jgi:hypothetical protein
MKRAKWLLFAAVVIVYVLFPIAEAVKRLVARLGLVAR